MNGLQWAQVHTLMRQEHEEVTGRLNRFIDLGWSRGMVNYVYDQWAKGVDLFTPNGIEPPRERHASQVLHV